MRRRSLARSGSVSRRARKIRALLLQDLAREAGVARPEDFAWKWHLLMKGSIVAAGEGDHQAARRAREVATLLLASEPGAAATG